MSNQGPMKAWRPREQRDLHRCKDANRAREHMDEAHVNSAPSLGRTTICLLIENEIQEGTQMPIGVCGVRLLITHVAHTIK